MDDYKLVKDIIQGVFITVFLNHVSLNPVMHDIALNESNYSDCLWFTKLTFGNVSQISLNMTISDAIMIIINTWSVNIKWTWIEYMITCIAQMF